MVDVIQQVTVHGSSLLEGDRHTEAGSAGREPDDRDRSSLLIRRLATVPMCITQSVKKRVGQRTVRNCTDLGSASRCSRNHSPALYSGLIACNFFQAQVAEIPCAPASKTSASAMAQPTRSIICNLLLCAPYCYLARSSSIARMRFERSISRTCSRTRTAASLPSWLANARARGCSCALQRCMATSATVAAGR
jgi:hypothetical protein